MRSAADIQAEISSVESQIAALEADIQNSPDVNDPEWEIARRNYINTGDMSGINNWYSRRDQNKQREIDNAFREREIALQEREHGIGGSVEPGSAKAKELLLAYKKAKKGLENAEAAFANDASAQAKSHLAFAKNELENAELELRFNGLGSYITPPPKGADAAAAASTGNARYTSDMNGLTAFDNQLAKRMAEMQSTKEKYYYPDADFDADADWLLSLMSNKELDNSVKEEARKRYADLYSDDSKKMGRYYRETDRKGREAGAKAKLDDALSKVTDRDFDTYYFEIKKNNGTYNASGLTFKKGKGNTIEVYKSDKLVKTLKKKG